MTTKIDAKQIQELIREALREFGRYSYDDKGPYEVMDVGAIVTRLKAELTPEEASQVVRELEAMGSREAVLAEYLDEELYDDTAIEAHPVEVTEVPPGTPRPVEIQAHRLVDVLKGLK